MKLKDIIKEEEWEQSPTGSYRTKKVNVDKETGQISWDVQYTPMIELQKEVEELYDAFKRTLKQYPDDAKLEKFFDVYASFKRQFKTHVNRKYN